jgi:hypothetical protein
MGIALSKAIWGITLLIIFGVLAETTVADRLSVLGCLHSSPKSSCIFSFRYMMSFWD